ncbi:PREDICTED: cold shock protein 1-like [Cyphomyrmex costatus]|uniref:cold shock protein 1-like n=1 Tax=Cyphomyrmex costatus TaxID=456900 RepID=UPI00085244E6|nr:PREDICTED: cold shock protein 1-like [Cyphomyrmex costatus]
MSGHNAKNCRTNNNSNNQSKLSVICQWCDKPGHSASNCWKKQNEQHNTQNKTKVICQICNNFGHVAKDCRARIGQSVAPSSSLFCRYCKGQGHLLESCELLASNKRREMNEQGNSDGSLKPGVQQGPERASHPSTSKKVQ